MRDVGAVYFGNAAAGLLTGQEMVRGQAALRKLPLSGQPIFNIENACASSSSAFFLAWSAVAAGQFDCVLVVGAEKFLHPDKSDHRARAVERASIRTSWPSMRQRVGGGRLLDLHGPLCREGPRLCEPQRRDGRTISPTSR